MALAANLAYVDLLGANVVKTGVHPNTTVQVKVSDLATVTDTAALTVEGFILALMNSLTDDQGADAARVFEISHGTPGIATRGGTACRYETYTIKIFSDAAITPLGPEDV